jgi:sarcosine oxidase
MGAATARALALRGRDVLLVEQFEVGHEHGSSHGRSRIVRLAYPEVEFVELAREGFAGWRELERESGRALLELSGLLELVEDAAAGSQAALAAAGAEFELVDPAAARARWSIQVPGGWTVLFQPEAGIIRADLAHRALVESAVAHGARLDTVDSETGVLEALALITERRIRHLPVVENGQIRGIVSIGDLVKYRMEMIEAEADAMRVYIQSA